jgi:hypothetical protein
MRRWLVPISVVVLIVAIPLAVFAANNAGDGPLNAQGWRSRTSSISTTSTTFQNVPAMSILTCSLGPVAVTFSGSTAGTQAGFQVTIDEGGTMLPGAAYFQAQTGLNAFSYTFVGNVSTFEGSDGHTFTLQWRSTGGTTTLLRADIVAQFNDPQTCQS